MYITMLPSSSFVCTNLPPMLPLTIHLKFGNTKIQTTTKILPRNKKDYQPVFTIYLFWVCHNSIPLCCWKNGYKYRLPLYCGMSRNTCNVCMYVIKSGYIFHKTSTIFVHISPFEYLTFSGQNFRPFLL